jgi:3-dehydroquinate dehydratase/shikimate dehydrogenase
LQKLGINAIYLPFRVPRGELPTFLDAFREVPVSGYSVTIPHKEPAAKSAAEQDDSVTKTGAANTLVATGAGFRATNTDAQAALDSLRAHLPLGPDNQQVALASRKVLLLGAGGAARALAHALHAEGVYVTIANRTEERGQALATEVGCKFVNWTARHQVECDTLINCTSVGMHPNIDEMPVHQSFFHPDLMVFDTVYTPETTMLIREARVRGCHTLTGVDMFVRQAGLQFKQFTGQEPPLDLMALVVRKALSPVHVKEEGEAES